MREIKFRAWDKQKKQTVYGIEETYDGLPYTEENKEIDLSNYGHMSCFSSWLCGGYEVMQHTGLKDKNGNEIYEGDVIRDIDKRVHTVVYERGMFGCYKSWLVNYETGERRKSIESLNNFLVDEAVVIGNIYENPELLEGK